MIFMILRKIILIKFMASEWDHFLLTFIAVGYYLLALLGFGYKTYFYQQWLVHMQSRHLNNCQTVDVSFRVRRIAYSIWILIKILISYTEL